MSGRSVFQVLKNLKMSENQPIRKHNTANSMEKKKRGTCIINLPISYLNPTFNLHK